MSDTVTLSEVPVRLVDFESVAALIVPSGTFDEEMFRSLINACAAVGVKPPLVICGDIEALTDEDLARAGLYRGEPS